LVMGAEQCFSAGPPRCVRHRVFNQLGVAAGQVVNFGLFQAYVEKLFVAMTQLYAPWNAVIRAVLGHDARQQVGGLVGVERSKRLGFDFNRFNHHTIEIEEKCVYMFLVRGFHCGLEAVFWYTVAQL